MRQVATIVFCMAAPSATDTSTNPLTRTHRVLLLRQTALFVITHVLTTKATHSRYLFVIVLLPLGSFVFLTCMHNWYSHLLLHSLLYYVQRAFYFSVRERLKAFLRIPGFKDLLDHEYLRPRSDNANIMTDTCDSPAWKDFMGSPSSPCSRIGLVGCTDGFQAHKSGSLSLKPFVLANFSLPPALRFKPEFMFLMMLLPVNCKGYALKKYYDFAARFELNSLYYTGTSYAR